MDSKCATFLFYGIILFVDVDECVSANLNECGTVGVTCVNTDE